MNKVMKMMSREVRINQSTLRRQAFMSQEHDPKSNHGKFVFLYFLKKKIDLLIFFFWGDIEKDPDSNAYICNGNATE